MSGYSIYCIKYTAREPYGEWVSHDEKRIHGYSEPKEDQSYYVAKSPEAAESHWRYWSQYTDKKRELTFISKEFVAHTTVLMEF